MSKSTHIICIFSGFQTDYEYEDDVEGSNILNDKCIAHNAATSNGVFAIARCCDFSLLQNITCSTSISNTTITTSYKSCSSINETLVGCTSYGLLGHNGNYPGNKSLDTNATVNNPYTWYTFIISACKYLQTCHK